MVLLRMAQWPTCLDRAFPGYLLVLKFTVVYRQLLVELLLGGWFFVFVGMVLCGLSYQ